MLPCASNADALAVQASRAASSATARASTPAIDRPALRGRPIHPNDPRTTRACLMHTPIHPQNQRAAPRRAQGASPRCTYSPGRAVLNAGTAPAAAGCARLGVPGSGGSFAGHPEEVSHGAADLLGELGYGHVAEDRLAGRERAHDRADRARHPHPAVEWDGGAREKATELLLDVVVLGAVALVVAQMLERAVVALMQEHELAVLDHLVDEPIDDARPCVGAGLLVLELVESLERLATEGVQTQMELQEDVFLALEVVVERGLRDAEPLGDVAQRGLVVALLGEQLEGDVEDPLARRAACRAAGARLRGRVRLRTRAPLRRCRSRHAPILLDGRQVACMMRRYLLADR